MFYTFLDTVSIIIDNDKIVDMSIEASKWKSADKHLSAGMNVLISAFGSMHL